MTLNTFCETEPKPTPNENKILQNETFDVKAEEYSFEQMESYLTSVIINMEKTRMSDDLLSD